MKLICKRLKNYAVFLADYILSLNFVIAVTLTSSYKLCQKLQHNRVFRINPTLAIKYIKVNHSKNMMK